MEESEGGLQNPRAVPANSRKELGPAVMQPA